MVGNWKVGGTIRSRRIEQSVEAQWVLNHQFLQIHEKGAPGPKTDGPAYEAIVMIGYDHTSERLRCALDGHLRRPFFRDAGLQRAIRKPD